MQLLKAIASVLLSVLVLISSMGFYVDHMICGMSGEHKLAINASIESCSDVCDSSDDYGITKSCCDYDSFYFQEDVPATTSNKKTEKTTSAFTFIPLAQVFAIPNCTENGSFNFTNEPDILPSVERHILLQTFII